jgi:hypothetical protein
LNVGQVLVLQFDSEGVLAYARARRGNSVYAAVRVPTYKIKCEIDELDSVSQRAWQAHEEFIAAAASSKRNSPWKDSFSEGALKYIEKILDVKLPRPSYLGNARSRRPSPGPEGRIIAEPIALQDQLQDIREIEQDKTLEESEREILILARRGQGQYRKELIELWERCAVTKCGPAEILRASHIKPWKMCSSHEERLDKFNGLLLTPNLDALFDRALISFDKQGHILISNRFPKKYCANLMISKKMKIRMLPEHERYLRHHRMRFAKLESGRQIDQPTPKESP